MKHPFKEYLTVSTTMTRLIAGHKLHPVIVKQICLVCYKVVLTLSSHSASALDIRGLSAPLPALTEDNTCSFCIRSFLVFLVVLTDRMKVLFKKKRSQYYHGGLPSGRSTLSRIIPDCGRILSPTVHLSDPFLDRLLLTQPSSLSSFCTFLARSVSHFMSGYAS